MSRHIVCSSSLNTTIPLQSNKLNSTFFSFATYPLFSSKMKFQLIATVAAMATSASAAALKPRDGTCKFRVGFARGQVRHAKKKPSPSVH